MRHFLKRNIGNVVNIILTQGKVTFGLRDVFVLRPLNVTVERSAVDGLGLGQGLVPGTSLIYNLSFPPVSQTPYLVHFCRQSPL